MSIQSYEMIEEQASGAIGGAPGASAAVGGEEIHTLLVSSPPSSKRKSWVVAAAALMMAGAFVGAVAFAPHFSDGGHEASKTQASSNEFASVPACGLSSCTSSGCDWDSAPFLCLAGGSAGGCATKESTWAVDVGDSCTSSCVLTECADTIQKAGSGAEGAEELPRRCGSCDKKQCSKLADHSSQACGKAAPFVCLNGAAAWGCTDSELAWASAPSTTCGECCDIGGC